MDIGVFTVSVVDETTTTVVGSVNVFSTQGESVTIKVPYTHTGASTGTTIHIKHVDGIQDTNIIRVHTVMVPVYTSVPQNVVSTVCNSENYRYGYNGKLKDNEWAGKGNSYEYGFRQYDPRIARFRSVDPLSFEFPMLSSYQYASLNPLYNIDLDGAEGTAAPGLSFSQVAFNAMSGKEGEIMFKTKFSLANEYDIYEQITYRPGGTDKTANTRADFFLKSKSSGNLYGIDIKTGNAVSSPNQIAAENAIENGQTMEMRTTKGSTLGIRKGSSFQLGGSIKIKIDLKTGGFKIESIKTNPQVKGAEELMKLPDQMKAIRFPIKVETPIMETVSPEEPMFPETNSPAKVEPFEPFEPFEPIEPFVP